MREIRTADPTPPKEIGLVRTSRHAVAVEHLAHFDAATAELVADGRDVGDDQVQAPYDKAPALTQLRRTIL
jgi:hypothetical protein